MNNRERFNQFAQHTQFGSKCEYTPQMERFLTEYEMRKHVQEFGTKQEKESLARRQRPFEFEPVKLIAIEL